MLLVLIVVGVVAGFVCGWFFGPAMVSVAWLGELFLNALKMMIIPLISAAVISGIGSLGDMRKFRRLGGITISYFVLTTSLAVLIGLVVVNVIEPGEGVNIGNATTISEKVASKQELGAQSIILSMVAPNLMAAASSGDALPIIIFCILFASALTAVGAEGQHVIKFFSGMNNAMLRMVSWVMLFAPIGIFGLVAGRMGRTGGGENFLKEIVAVGWYVVTVLSGLAVHLALLTLVLLFVAKRGLGFYRGMFRAFLTAFGTASSSATMPLTIQCLHEERVDPTAIELTIPVGTTINMNGTALYESVAAMFIAQAYGMHLGFEQQVLVFITATLAAVGAAGIPEAGLVTMVIVLNAVGIPLEGVGLLLAVDWFLDRFRTAVNVVGDSVGAAVIHRFIPR